MITVSSNMLRFLTFFQDAQTVIGFLKHYGLEKDFKLNIEPNHTTLAGHDYEHDIEISSRLPLFLTTLKFDKIWNARVCRFQHW